MAMSRVRSITLLSILLTVVSPVWAQDPKAVGVVTALTGRADLKRPQAPEAALRLRDNLFIRDVVDTREQSLARILLMGKSSVTVRELSRFEIREETRPDGSQRALINLALGKIRVMVAARLLKPGDEVQVRTSNAIASVRGTDGIFEASILPDGRPLTVITGISGEFQLSLPTVAPFVAKGREFLAALDHGGRPIQRSLPLVAMADRSSDGGPGLKLAQAPGLLVTGGLQTQVAGPAGAQTLAQAILSQRQLNQVTVNFQVNVGASGASQPPPATADRVATIAVTTAETLATGIQTGGATTGGDIAPTTKSLATNATPTTVGGGGTTLTPTTPITPLTVNPNPVITPPPPPPPLPPPPRPSPKNLLPTTNQFRPDKSPPPSPQNLLPETNQFSPPKSQPPPPPPPQNLLPETNQFKPSKSR